MNHWLIALGVFGILWFLACFWLLSATQRNLQNLPPHLRGEKMSNGRMVWTAVQAMLFTLRLFLFVAFFLILSFGVTIFCLVTRRPIPKGQPMNWPDEYKDEQRSI